MSFRWPVDNVRITQGFGDDPAYYKQFNQIGHNGIDLADDIGTAVYAADEGTIAFEGWGQNHSWALAPAGIWILLNNGGLYSGYAHLSDTVVNKGQHVNKGQLIGHSGQTGAATGPHTHFEALPINPNFSNGYAGRVTPIPYMDSTNAAPAAGNNDMTPNFIRRTYYMINNVSPSQAEVDFHMAKSNPESFVNGFGDTPLWMTVSHQRDSLQDQVNTLTQQVADLTNQLTAAQGGSADSIKALQTQLDEKQTLLTKANGDLAAAVAQIEELKKQLPQNVDTATVSGLKLALLTLKQFIKQVIGVK